MANPPAAVAKPPPVAEAAAAAATAADASASDDVGGAAAAATAVKKERDPIRIVPAVKQPEPPKDPNVPSDRDVIMDQEEMQGTALLLDLIRIHYYLWLLEDAMDDNSAQKTKAVPTDPSKVEELAKRLIVLMQRGKLYELSGLKDVPRPFLHGEGRFFQKDGTDGWKRVYSENDIQHYVATTILAQFKAMSEQTPSPELMEAVKDLYKNSNPKGKTLDERAAGPRPIDVLLLPIDHDLHEIMAYEQQSGNKRLLHLASQHVSSDESVESAKRVQAAIQLITNKVDVEEAGGAVVQKTPRFVVQTISKDSATTHAWQEMQVQEMAEFVSIFVFEVFREKRIYDAAAMGRAGTTATMVGLADLNSTGDANQIQPGGQGIDAPTTHDVLFGRGGMTNGHPGNRRFRDIIALHRPDYIKASKMDKPVSVKYVEELEIGDTMATYLTSTFVFLSDRPISSFPKQNVARRIVRAIRQGNPVGRFLKKDDDGLWRDVGDKVAAEKTSQGLRERSNVEKRRRSAERRALEKAAAEAGDPPPPKKMKRDPQDPSGMFLAGPVQDFGTTIPLSLSMKPTKGTKKTKKGVMDEEDDHMTSLPPNAVDKDGHVLVTDYDILLGRGGLTNHHKGNKRFRDIVALHRADYIRAPKIQKPSVARVIVRAIRNGDPPGRFLRKNEETGHWEDVGDKKAAEKTSQALREKIKGDDEKGVPAPGIAAAIPGGAEVSVAAAAAAAAEEEADAAVKMEGGTLNAAEV